MKSEAEIRAEYNAVKYKVEIFHSGGPDPRDQRGNVITNLDNIYNEGMLEAFKFVLSKQ